MEKAHKEGYRGNVTNRLAELNWQIVPIYGYPALNVRTPDPAEMKAVAWQARTHPDAPWFDVPIWNLKKTKESGLEVRELYAAVD